MDGTVIQTFAGDSAPMITLSLTRDDGSIVNLTDASVYLIIEDPDTKLPTNNFNSNLGITNHCVITNPSGGVCTYTWNRTGTDCPDVGIYPANLRIIYQDGSKETYRMIISAEAPIYGAVLS